MEGCRRRTIERGAGRGPSLPEPRAAWEPIMTRTHWIACAAIVVALGATVWLAGSGGARMDMTPPDTSQLAPGAAIAEVAIPASLSAEAAMGQRAFEAVCADCHGTAAAGRAGIAPPLVHEYYEPSHHGDAAFLSAAANGVQAHHWSFGNMPAQDGLTRADVMNIIAYVRALQRENGIL
jgi:mono/diheme cytochrome c family protein